MNRLIVVCVGLALSGALTASVDAALVSYIPLDNTYDNAVAGRLGGTAGGSPVFSGTDTPVAHSTHAVQLDGASFVRFGAQGSGTDPENLFYENVFLGDFTLSFWAKSDYASSALPADMAYPVDFGQSHALGVGVHFNKSHGSFTNDTIGGYDDGISFNGPAGNADQWYHIAMARQGTTTTLYVGGNPVDNGTSGYTDLDQTYPFTIGKGAKADSRYWTGLVDDVALWDTALEPGDIQGLADGTIAPPDVAPPPPEGIHWDFGADVFDDNGGSRTEAVGDWQDNARWSYRGADIEADGDVIASDPSDFDIMDSFSGSQWQFGSEAYPSVRISDTTVHPTDTLAAVVAWEADFSGMIDYSYILTETNNNTQASPGYQLFLWDESEGLLSLLAKDDVLGDVPEDLFASESVSGSLPVASGDMLLMAIDDGGNGSGNDRVRLQGYITYQPVIPEPSSLGLAALGLLSLAVYGRRRKQRE
jgi:hypothetical protein